jgi:hypothetical protein
MYLKKIAVLTALTVCVAVNGAPAHASMSALDCLKSSAQSDGLAGCLNESGKGTSAAVPADNMASRTGTAPSLGAASLDTGEKKHPANVPTPLGWTTAMDGSLKAGFFNGLDSGFKTVFAGIEYLPIRGMMACGDPYESNAGTIAFGALGILLSIPASIIGAVVGAPLGAVAGMIAEKVSPGSTKDWFTF